MTTHDISCIFEASNTLKIASDRIMRIADSVMDEGAYNRLKSLENGMRMESSDMIAIAKMYLETEERDRRANA